MAEILNILLNLWGAIKGMNYLELIGAATILLNGMLMIALAIPGEQPDKFLQGLVDKLKAISLKKS